MAKKLTSEQFWKLYEKLPQELKDVLFAEETGDNIYEICKRNEVEENIEQIVDIVGQVLVGILPPEDFQKALEKEISLKNNVAKKVTREINRFIFYPVKPSLEEIYKIEISPTTTPVEKARPTEETEEQAETPQRQDVYREPIE